MRGKDAFSGDHASEVVRRGLPTNEHGLATFCLCFNGCFSGKDRFAHCSTRRCVEASCNHIVFCIGIELRVEELIELFGIDTHDRFFFGDEALFDHRDSNMKRCSSSTLANARLEHPELALLDGELDIAHIAEVILEQREDAFGLLACFFEARGVLKVGDR